MSPLLVRHRPEPLLHQELQHLIGFQPLKHLRPQQSAGNQILYVQIRRQTVYSDARK